MDGRVLMTGSEATWGLEMNEMNADQGNDGIEDDWSWEMADDSPSP